MSFFSHVHVHSKLKQNLNGFESYLGTPKIHFEETVQQSYMSGPYAQTKGFQWMTL
jgi:hypothetical protein